MQTENITELLLQLESFWTKSKAPILGKLNPGVSKSNNNIPYFSGILPAQYWDLYTWRDGIKPSQKDTIGSLSMFPFGIFLSQERAAEVQREMVDHNLGWDRMKFPVFEGGGGEYFLIECDSTRDSYGMILYYSIKDFEFNRIIGYFDSLYTLFLTIYECSIDGIFRYNNDSFDCDDDKYFEVARRFNPRSKYWLLFEAK